MKSLGGKRESAQHPTAPIRERERKDARSRTRQKYLQTDLGISESDEPPLTAMITLREFFVVTGTSLADRCNFYFLALDFRQ